MRQWIKAGHPHLHCSCVFVSLQFHAASLWILPTLRGYYMALSSTICGGKSSRVEPSRAVPYSGETAIDKHIHTATSGRGELDAVDLTEAGGEDGRRGGVVAEPIRSICCLRTVDPDHQVAVSQNLEREEREELVSTFQVKVWKMMLCVYSNSSIKLWWICI